MRVPAWLLALCLLALPTRIAHASSVDVSIDKTGKVSFVSRPTAKDNIICGVDEGTVRVFLDPACQQCAADNEDEADVLDAKQLDGSDNIENLARASVASRLARFRRQLLLGRPLFCGRKGLAAGEPLLTLTPKPPKPLSPESLRLTSAFPASAAPTATSMVWHGWNDASFTPLLEGVGQAHPVCMYMAGDTALRQPACQVALSRSASGGGVFTFMPAPPVQARSVAVYFGKADPTGNAHLTLPLETCQFAAAAPYDRLFAGASRQVLYVGASSGCQRRLQRESSVTLRATGKASIGARVRAVDELGLTALDLGSVATDVTKDGWELAASSGDALGALSVTGAEVPVKVVLDSAGKPALEIHYQAEFFDERQMPRSTDGFAVVTRAEQETETSSFLYVENTPQLTVSTGLRALENALKEMRAPDHCEPPGPDSSEHACPHQKLLWSVRAMNWRDAIWLHSGGSLEYPRRQWELNTARIDELADIDFAVLSASQEPLELELELRDPARDVTVLATEILVASGARRESLALPIADALFVSCGELDELRIEPDLVGFGGTAEGLDVVVHGATRAINEDDLGTGQCRIHYSPTRMVALSDGGDAYQSRMRLRHFGSQDLEIVVRRGSAEKKLIWQIDPNVASSLALPKPEGPDDTGYFTVSAKQLSPGVPQVVRRGSAVAEAQRPLAAIVADLNFDANLRPRGRHAWLDVPIRTFVTLPVELMGVRFPSNPRELEASSDNPNAQIITGRVGALIALEPWDYDIGANPSPIPMRFMTGFMFFKVGEGRFAPTWLTGMQLTFPILDLPKGATQDQLGVDAAIGFFWEHDLQDSGGDHLLVTMGFDVLSLFGSK